MMALGMERRGVYERHRVGLESTWQWMTSGKVRDDCEVTGLGDWKNGSILDQIGRGVNLEGKVDES